MSNKNSNYRVMKFLEPVDKKVKGKGYVKLDIRGIKGNIIVSVENLSDVSSASEVYLYKDKNNKIKLGDINNKKGTIKKIITFSSNTAIEDYNVCGIVSDNKIHLYANLFNSISANDVKRLEEEPIKQEEAKAKEDNYLHSETNMPQIPDKKIDQEEVSNENQRDIAQENEEEDKRSTANNEVDNNAETANLNRKRKIKKSENKKVEYKEDEDTKLNDLLSKIDKSNEEESINEIEAGMEVFKKVDYQEDDEDNAFDKNLYSFLNFYEKSEPLSVEIEDISWWYIPYGDKGLQNGILPYFNQIISAYYPYPMSARVTTCNNLMRKYGHYIFGIYKKDNKVEKFVYGVPGEFKREEQPYKGITGFKNWSYKNENIRGNYGYWLAFIDSETGEATEPPQISVKK